MLWCPNFSYFYSTYAAIGISMTSPSTVTTILSLTSASSVHSYSMIAGTHKPGATGFSGFVTLSLNFWKYQESFHAFIKNIETTIFCIVKHGRDRQHENAIDWNFKSLSLPLRFILNLHGDHRQAVLRWRKARVVFCNSARKCTAKPPWLTRWKPYITAVFFFLSPAQFEPAWQKYVACHETTSLSNAPSGHSLLGYHSLHEPNLETFCILIC